MEYQSTRNESLTASSAEAIVTGIAPDGGLFVPTSIPKISEDEIAEMIDMNYNSRAVLILSKFLTDFKRNEVKDCVDGAYSKEKFETDSIAPIYKLSDNEYVLELWHGPTCAFKDMALQILPHLLTTSAKKVSKENEIVIIVATSGDTGKAALEGFKDVPGTRIMVFYPTDGVSEIQKLQMATQDGNNVSVVAINGNFDDAQNGVKEIFGNKNFETEMEKKGFSLSSANSINWGRLVPQIVYYISSYCELLKNEEIKPGEEINVCVPTGNFGNILAAYYAKEMGIPIKKLICASNSNNVLTEFIRTGVYNRNRGFVQTISPSMDILISSNLERLLFHMTDADTELVKIWMNSLKETGKYEVTDRIKEKFADLFYGAYCGDKFTQDTIAEINEQYGYLMDTHTAVGQNVYEQYVAETKDTTKTILASTASPFKFNRSVAEAILTPDQIAEKSEFELLELVSKESHLKIPKSIAELEDKDIRFNDVVDSDKMEDAVREFLN